MMIPLTPGSSGIAEVGATTMYALFIPASVVGIFVVLWRIVLYYFNIALGILQPHHHRPQGKRRTPINRQTPVKSPHLLYQTSNHCAQA